MPGVLTLRLPLTIKLVSVPTLVIFGCAFVVKVPVKFVTDKVFVTLLNVKPLLAPYVLPVSLNNT